MLNTALWPLQVAIVKRFESDEPLMAMVKAVKDSVEKDTPFPYVTIGDPQVVPFETKTSFGEEITIVLHCWSRYEGKKEAYEILNLMLRALTKSPLMIEGDFSIFGVKLEQLTVIKDIDEVTKHGIMRIRFHINNGRE